jgi:hypothetical protein
MPSRDCGAGKRSLARSWDICLGFGSGHGQGLRDQMEQASSSCYGPTPTDPESGRGGYPVRIVPEDADVRWLLEMLDPSARDTLRRILIRDKADRDAIAMKLLGTHNHPARTWADVVDLSPCTRNPAMGRTAARGDRRFVVTSSRAIQRARVATVRRT